MQSFDILAIIIVAFTTFRGFYRGFIWQVAALASIFVSLYAAFRFRENVTPHIPLDEPWNIGVAMVVIFLFTSLIIWAICRVLEEFIERIKLKDFDRQAGGILGLLKGAILCVIILIIVTTVFDGAVRDNALQSRSGQIITAALQRSVPLLPDEIRDPIEPFLAFAFSGSKPSEPLAISDSSSRTSPATEAFEPGEFFGSLLDRFKAFAE